MKYFMDNLNDGIFVEQIEIVFKVFFIENGVGKLKVLLDLFDCFKGKLNDFFWGEEGLYFLKDWSNLILMGKLQKLKIKFDKCIIFQDLINMVYFIENISENLNDLYFKKKVRVIFRYFKDLLQSVKFKFVEKVKGK